MSSAVRHPFACRASARASTTTNLCRIFGNTCSVAYFLKGSSDAFGQPPLCISLRKGRTFVTDRVFHRLFVESKLVDWTSRIVAQSVTLKQHKLCCKTAASYRLLCAEIFFVSRPGSRSSLVGHLAKLHGRAAQQCCFDMTGFMETNVLSASDRYGRRCARGAVR